jgi:hypothetical protein
MVASSANTILPRAPAACGDIARALATKAAISSDADGLACGSGLPGAAFRGADISLVDFGLVGSPDIRTRNCRELYVGRDRQAVNGGLRRVDSGNDQFVTARGDFDADGFNDETEPAAGSRIFGFLVSTGASELSVSPKNLSSMV